MKTHQKTAFRVALMVLVMLGLCFGSGVARSEELYNGIVLPEQWPPDYGDLTHEPMRVPYLDSPPKVIPIDIGRQLFVDDFLIEQTTLKRTFHLGRYYPKNPILKPDRSWEQEPWDQETRSRPSPTAMVFSDGVWYDPQDQLFKMWYMGGSRKSTCYATSPNGISWQKPLLDVMPGTNMVHTRSHDSTAVWLRDSATVWLDQKAEDPAARFKMFSIYRDRSKEHYGCSVFLSPDGIHWGEPLAETKSLGDRTTVFYNPFRRKWVYSIRCSASGVEYMGRSRQYREHDDPVAGAQWTDAEAPLWIGADKYDLPLPEIEFDNDGRKMVAQLYNLDAVAYESLMLGLFTIWPGQPKDRAKPNYVCLGFSRDGFHWHRPDHRPFVGVSEQHGDWNWANVQSAGGGCLVAGEKLYFYVSGRAGVKGSTESGVCTTGLATLRRDGFASMDAEESEGTLTTRPVRFTGKHLFVNAEASQGELSVEVLDEAGKAIAPFTRDNCFFVTNDGTLQSVAWNGTDDLSPLVDKPVRFKFYLRTAKLYAFWVSPDRSGASQGYVAAGGPGLTGPRDTLGSKSYEAARALAQE
jgi:hypothetical protein